MDKSETLSVFLMVLLLAFAVVIVDDRWLRVAIAVLPALMLAQRALKSSAPPQTSSDTAVVDDRRQDHEVRGYIDELLKHFREFYATCHLTGAGVLTPEAAEERATNLERELNRLLATITRTARARSEAGADAADEEPSPEREAG